MKWEILPLALNWTEAKSLSTFKNRAMPTALEIQEWAKINQPNVDVWTKEENHLAPETAKCWSGRYQTVKVKDKSKKCLVILRSTHL